MRSNLLALLLVFFCALPQEIIAQDQSNPLIDVGCRMVEQNRSQVECPNMLGQFESISIEPTEEELSELGRYLPYSVREAALLSNRTGILLRCPFEGEVYVLCHATASILKADGVPVAWVRAEDDETRIHAFICGRGRTNGLVLETRADWEILQGFSRIYRRIQGQGSCPAVSQTVADEVLTARNAYYLIGERLRELDEEENQP